VDETDGAHVRRREHADPVALAQTVGDKPSGGLGNEAVEIGVAPRLTVLGADERRAVR